MKISGEFARRRSTNPDDVPHASSRFPWRRPSPTQRGVDRQAVFFADRDRQVYLHLVQRAAAQFGTELVGYCLMPNHIHWIAVPESPTSLIKTFGRAHGRYAQYCNSLLQRSGHFWQNRFYSCALDDAQLWAALRYVELNPVRSGLRATAEDWTWSSALCTSDAKLRRGGSIWTCGGRGLLLANGSTTWGRERLAKRRPRFGSIHIAAGP